MGREPVSAFSPLYEQESSLARAWNKTACFLFLLVSFSSSSSSALLDDGAIYLILVSRLDFTVCHAKNLIYHTFCWRAICMRLQPHPAR